MKTTRIYNEKTDIYSLGQTFFRFIESKDRYSEEFIKLIDDLRANEENNRPNFTIDDKERNLIINSSKINNHSTKIKYFNIEKNILLISD